MSDPYKKIFEIKTDDNGRVIGFTVTASSSEKSINRNAEYFKIGDQVIAIASFRTKISATEAKRTIGEAKPENNEEFSIVEEKDGMAIVETKWTDYLDEDMGGLLTAEMQYVGDGDLKQLDHEIPIYQWQNNKFIINGQEVSSTSNTIKKLYEDGLRMNSISPIFDEPVKDVQDKILDIAIKAYQTREDEHFAPQSGHKAWDMGKGIDTFVLSEGAFYEIFGFEDDDYQNKIYKPNEMRRLIRDFKDSWHNARNQHTEKDKLSVFIEPEKEYIQQVEYFTRDGITYVQLFDNEESKIVAAAKFKDKGVKIDVIGENGKIHDDEIIKIYKDDDAQSLEAARKIELLITVGEAKASLKETEIRSATENSYNKGDAPIKSSDLIKK